MVDIKEAVNALTIFRQNWCRDDEWEMYNCDFCEFQKENGNCVMKEFVFGHKYGIEKDKLEFFK